MIRRMNSMGLWRIMAAFFIFLSLLIFIPGSVYATSKKNDSTLSIAVASDFMLPLQNLTAPFEKEHHVHLLFISGATGNLYQQIENGADFDLFFSADAEHIEKLQQQGLIINSTRRTYAIGQLVMWAPHQKIAQKSLPVLLHNKPLLAIANPEIAPYGRAAKEMLTSLGLWPYDSSKLLMGENVHQAFNYVIEGGASLGLLDLASVLHWKALKKESSQEDIIFVPQEYYAPLKQQVAVLKETQHREIAIALLNFLQTSELQQRLQKEGYLIPSRSS